MGLLTFQLTRHPRGVTDTKAKIVRAQCISTHTPLAGRDRNRVNRVHRRQQFQLTRPSRGVTRTSRVGIHFYGNFNSHAPRGA